MENEKTKECVAEMLLESETSGAEARKSGAIGEKTPKPEEKTEAAIQAEIVKNLRHLGFFCYSTPNEQTAKNAVHTAHLKAMGLYPGMADLTVWLGNGMVAYLEVKKPGGRLSPAQKRFLRKCDNAGYPYIVVHSWKETYECLMNRFFVERFFSGRSKTNAEGKN